MFLINEARTTKVHVNKFIGPVCKLGGSPDDIEEPIRKKTVQNLYMNANGGIQRHVCPCGYSLRICKGGA